MADTLSPIMATWCVSLTFSYEEDDKCSDECDDKSNETFGQVGQRGGPEEVLEFSKRTAEQVKAILDQGQVRQLCGSFIPDICHFFTRATFLENKIYIEITCKLRQNTQ